MVDFFGNRVTFSSFVYIIVKDVVSLQNNNAIEKEEMKDVRCKMR